MFGGRAPQSPVWVRPRSGALRLFQRRRMGVCGVCVIVCWCVFVEVGKRALRYHGPGLDDGVMVRAGAGEGCHGAVATTVGVSGMFVGG
jgi:hypothetical protein